MEKASRFSNKSRKTAGCPIHAVSSHEWAFALRANRFPSPKNKSRKTAKKIVAPKTSSRKPSLPHNPPHFVHKLTTRKHPKTQKPPAKTTFSPPNFFRQQKPEN
jgi:hypothetical protein